MHKVLLFSEKPGSEQEVSQRNLSRVKSRLNKERASVRVNPSQGVLGNAQAADNRAPQGTSHDYMH